MKLGAEEEEDGLLAMEMWKEAQLGILQVWLEHRQAHL